MHQVLGDHPGSLGKRGQRRSSTSSTAWVSGRWVASHTASPGSLARSRAVSWVISKCLDSGARRRGLPSGEDAVALRLCRLPRGAGSPDSSSHSLEAARLDSWGVTGRVPPRGYFTGWRLKWPRDCVPSSKSSGPDTVGGRGGLCQPPRPPPSPAQHSLASSGALASSSSSVWSGCGAGACREIQSSRFDRAGDTR